MIQSLDVMLCYVESDPIGLNGWLNTYVYVGANALSLVDPDGHSHQPGVEHHDCPHLHVYKNNISVGIVKYKRGSF